jgi:beta-glucanase (GH16 family)
MPRQRQRIAAMLFAPLAAASIARAQTLPGYTLQWADEFNATTVDTARWEVLNRKDSFNNEKQYYLPSQVTSTGGVLRITATNQPFDTKAYRSGLVRTWAEQTYGRWEIRASLPSTQGMWPAIWLLPRNANWPAGGEIDIMENRGSASTIVGSAYHFGATVAQHAYAAQDFSYSVNGTPVSFQGSMHDYAVEWDADRIRYFVDGVPHYTLYRNAVPVSATPMSLILNLAVGGDYGGDPNGTTVFPQRLDVDYVRVYSRNANAPALQNASFERTAGEYFGEWIEYSNAANVRFDGVAANARTGTKAVQMYGRFDGTTQNNSGLFQELPAAEGQVWQVGAWGRNRPGDRLLGQNVGRMKVEFVDANGNVIGVSQFDPINSATPESYRESVVRAVAPANTKFARAVLEMVQRNSAGGAVNWDDAALSRVFASSIAGDINLDGTRDARDLDAALHSLAPANTFLDFDGNLTVNDADVDRLLADAFRTRRGDANLDGVVNFDDLLALAASYGRTGSGTWSAGDFTGEGNVDFDDLLRLASNYNLPALPAAPAPFVAVPEPGASVISCFVSAALLRRRRGITSVHTRFLSNPEE